MPWAFDGKWDSCPSTTFAGPGYAQGQPCKGFGYRAGDDGGSSVPVTGTLSCDVCDLNGEDYGAGVHGAPCEGISNTGATIGGVWECR